MERLLIVTGASSGLGAALVAAAEGVTVASVSRRAGPGIHLGADLSDPGCWAEVTAWMGGLVASEPWDWVGLVQCAATLKPIGFAGEVDAALYTSNVLLNSASFQVLGGGFLETMRTHGRSGCLCLISSGAASNPYLGWSSYNASKAATDQWCRTVGAEQEERGGRVRVMSVAPGVIDTDMQALIRATPPERFPKVERFRSRHASGELLSPDEVAAKLWALVVRTDLENGIVLDLRSFD